MHKFGTWAVVLVLSGAAVRADYETRKHVGTTYPVVRWTGTVADAGLEQKCPKDGLISSQKDFAALWKAWGAEGPAPGIDFDTHFVVVATKAGYRPWLVGLFHFADGDSTAPTMYNDGERCPGFGYGLGVFPRDKVKTMDSKAVPKP